MIKSFSRLINIAIITGFLAACSMGGGETGTGFDQEQTTQGVITGFGSVIINGIHYKTNNTTVLFDDAAATESQLKVGMLVTLDGAVNSAGTEGIANTIIFERDVEGEVIANNYLVDNTLNILGQTVYVDNETIFESQVAAIPTIDLVAVGNMLEVSGFTDGSGQIFATRIEVKSSARSTEKVEVKGVVQNLNGVLFDLGSLAIDASNAAYSNMTANDLANGILVKVESEIGLVNGILQASEVKLKEQAVLSIEPRIEDETEEVEIEGVITAITDATQIFINGQKVLIDSNTQFENIDINNITVGLRVDLEGQLSASGEILALELEGKKVSSSKLEGLITAIDSARTTITVNGINITVTETTRLLDDSENSDENEKRFFNFSNLVVGDKVELSFYADTATGTNIATKLEREEKEGSEVDDSGSTDQPSDGTDSDSTDGGDSSSGEQTVDQWEINGVITSLDTVAMTLVVEGISIDYSQITEMVNIAIGDEVDVHGTIQNAVWVASEIELEGEEEST